MILRYVMTLAVLMMSVGYSHAGTKSDSTDAAAQEAEYERMSAQYDNDVREAPRRKSDDPIRVTVLSSLTKKEQKKQKVLKGYKGLIKELQGDSLLKVTEFEYSPEFDKIENSRSMHVLMDLSMAKGIESDVYVYPYFDGGSANAAADIVSAYDNAIHKAEPQSGETLAAQVRQIVKADVGPTLPSVESIMAINKKYKQFKRYKNYAVAAQVLSKKTGFGLGVLKAWKYTK